MTRDEFFNALWELVKDTDVNWEETFVGDEDEGEIYVKFKNIAYTNGLDQLGISVYASSDAEKGG